MKLDTVRLSHIDTMRGIAILMVILVPTAQSVRNTSWLLSVVSMYGQTGVQLFFVASSFTLCQSWHNRSHEKNKILNYIIRRLFRIAPAYYLGIILYLLISILESQAEFEQNTEKQDSITYRILIMGEATKRLSPEFIEQHSNIPWRQIAAMRNFLVYEYDSAKRTLRERIDLDVLWDVIHNNIPELLNLLEPLLASE